MQREVICSKYQYYKTIKRLTCLETKEWGLVNWQLKDPGCSEWSYSSVTVKVLLELCTYVILTFDVSVSEI